MKKYYAMISGNIYYIQEKRITNFEFFWKIWKNDYMLCIQDQSKSKLNSTNIEASRII